MQTKCDRIARFPRVVNAYRLPWKDYFTCSSCLSYHVSAPKENDNRKESAHPFFLCSLPLKIFSIPFLPATLPQSSTGARHAHDDTRLVARSHCQKPLMGLQVTSADDERHLERWGRFLLLGHTQ